MIHYQLNVKCANESDNNSYKKRLPLQNAVTSGSKEDPANSASLLPNLPDQIQSLLISKHPYTDKRGPYRGELNNKEANANLDGGADQSEHRKGLRTLCQTTEESSKWFKQKSWKERLERAHETNSLILFENLDPKKIQHNKFCSLHNGRALVIFKSKDVADSVVSELNNRCLMLDVQRLSKDPYQV